MITQSATVGFIGSALSKFQGELKNSDKTSVNPHFKSYYSGLGKITESFRPLLAKYGLCLSQTTEKVEGDWCLITKMIHESGEWLLGYYPIFAKDNSPQSWASSVTYARRYTAQAIIMQGSANDASDDDGNGASLGDQEPMTGSNNLGYSGLSGNNFHGSMVLNATYPSEQRFEPNNNAARYCTEPQIYKIGELTKGLGWDNDMAQEWLEKTTGQKTRKNLTKNQASEVIGTLLKLHEASGLKESEDFGNNIDI